MGGTARYCGVLHDTIGHWGVLVSSKGYCWLLWGKSSRNSQRFFYLNI
jgi:hypothetical protein